MDLFDLLEDEKKPKKVPIPTPKVEPIPPEKTKEEPKKIEPEPIIHRVVVEPVEIVIDGTKYIFRDDQRRYNSRMEREIAAVSILIPKLIGKETDERIKLLKPFEKGEKSKASHLIDYCKERFSNTHLSEILTFIRKAAAASRSKIAAAIKENSLEKAKEIYSIPKRRGPKKQRLARKKSEKIGELETKLQKLSHEKINAALKRELAFENQNLNPSTRTKLPELRPVSLKSLQVPPSRKRLNPKKGVIYTNCHNRWMTLKQQIDALNKPTSFTESKLKYPVAQIIVSLPDKVTASNEQAIWMIHRHMARMGIDPTQHTYIIYQHTNTGLNHYHMVYNRVRLDGGVHHLPGANQVCHIESAIQDIGFGISPQIAALTGRDKLSRIVQSRLANGNHCAEIRYYKKPTVQVPVVGEEAHIRIEKVGGCSLKTAGGGFVKHQLFHSAKWLVHHVLQ